jgi:hypothetical protein
VPAVDLVDETYVVADRATLAAVVGDTGRWAQWWPELSLSVFMDRGLDGIRWSVTGRWVGSLEIWLEQVGDGVLVHHYARLDPVDHATGVARPLPHDAAGWRRAARARARRARAWKRSVWALKDELERGRPVGAARVQAADGGPASGPPAPTRLAPDGG